MAVTTISSAVHITPVVIKTFFKHSKRKAEKFRAASDEEDAKDDIFFDEAFHIVKAFIEMGTHNTVESLQAFTNTHVPAPYWATVVPVIIPLSVCNQSADILINWFGQQELTQVVGGERWWQVRGMDGLDAEWITEKEYLDKDDLSDSFKDRKLTNEEELVLRMDKLDTVMLYVHGGGYFWGSINTHRYQIIRYARKIRGRAFAVNYRKAPQYPWPCPLADVIAAYLYLTQPPENAMHKPIPPSKIVFAGDSAGGGLALSCLTVLRDLGLPLPAGAVLISPWVDLTHSFPSVMNNTHTDIIPPHGFLAKPSTLWPMDPVPLPDGRVRTSQSNPPPKPGHADTLGKSTLPEAERASRSSSPVLTQQEMLSQGSETSAETYDIDKQEPKPPKVLMEDPEAIPLELCSQIQLYATNEQLTHPLVSPILQGSLCNLPPLYIIAGECEVLRDEIIYLAHRAAFPTRYPTRRGALQGRRQKENADKFITPTKVTLHVFDDMCHVLTVFTFTESAKHAYRSITSFVKEVTNGGSLAMKHPTAVSPGQHSDGVDSMAGSMVRQRVNIHGQTRPMEPMDEISALNIPPEHVGLIRQAPAERWFNGQKEWDKMYRKRAKKAIRTRKKITLKAQKLLENARSQGLQLSDGSDRDIPYPLHKRGDGIIQKDRRWGPLDLEHEQPPPSAIAQRRDTPEALALLKKSIYHTAPITHSTVPKLKMSDVIRATFDPHDDPQRPPRQSVSEQQVKANIIPVHGLKIWDGLVRYFMQESTKKAAKTATSAANNVYTKLT